MASWIPTGRRTRRRSMRAGRAGLHQVRGRHELVRPLCICSVPKRAASFWSPTGRRSARSPRGSEIAHHLLQRVRAFCAIKPHAFPRYLSSHWPLFWKNKCVGEDDVWNYAEVGGIMIGTAFAGRSMKGRTEKHPHKCLFSSPRISM
jgi:hypothetical protein